MQAVTLPQDLGIPQNEGPVLFDYQTARNCSKQEVILSHWTFSFLQSGTKEVFSHSEKMSISNSHFILMKPGHCLMTETTPESNLYRSLLLFIPRQVLIQFINDQSLSTTADRNEYVQVFAYDSYLKQVGKSLEGILHLSESARQNLLKIKAQEILLYLIEKEGRNFIEFINLSGVDKHVEFSQIIEANIHNKLTLKELAFLCHMSVATFKRRFEEVYQDSPIRWFQNKRLERAAQLLKTGSRPTEIFEEAGYSSLSNFTQAFKGKYGDTPAQFIED